MTRTPGTPGTPGTPATMRYAPVLYAAAVANLALGVWQSLQPARLTDFHQVTDWIRRWMGGFDVYAPPSVVDYPPWALVVLTPLGVIPAGLQAPLWIAVNAGLAIALAVHLARLTGEPRSLHARIAALFLTAAAFRTLNQFSLFALVVALAGATLHWRVAGGLILGISLMKPQIGGVVALWVLLSWHPRRFLVALAVPFVLTMFYAEHVGTTAMTVLHEYAGNLQSVHGHAIPFIGHTDLRAWIVARWPSAPPGLWLSMLLALALVSPALVAVAVRRRPLDRSLELLAFCGVVSLLAVRHLSYDLLLVLPALAAWRTIPFSARSPGTGGTGIAGRSNRWGSGATGLMFVILCAWLLLDPSAIARRVLPRMEAPDALTTVLLQADRILCVVLWGVLSVRLFARHETRERQTRARA